MDKITFNYHSCFSVELDGCILVFDYYNPNEHTRSSLGGTFAELNKDKEIYFFNSHRHPDHYSKDVFDFEKDYKDVNFILSDDIWIKEKEAKANVTLVSPDKSYQIGDVKVETIKSTDEGVAFVVTAGEKTIYYAGDLHWWYWAEKGADYVKKWGDLYAREIDKISDKAFDYSFVVLDPRMGEFEAEGLRMFLEKVPDHGKVIPMHMWGDYDIIDRFLESDFGKKYKNDIVKITSNGQVFSNVR